VVLVNSGRFIFFKCQSRWISYFVNNQIAVIVLTRSNTCTIWYHKTSDKENSFDLSKSSWCSICFNNQKTTSDWQKFTLGVKYENTNNFNNNVYSEGTNTNNSIDDYFLYYANGAPTVF
jgi:hypothetical protein